MGNILRTKKKISTLIELIVLRTIFAFRYRQIEKAEWKWNVNGKWRDLLCSASIPILRAKLNRREEKKCFQFNCFQFLFVSRCCCRRRLCVCVYGVLCRLCLGSIVFQSSLARAMCFCLWAWLLSSLWNTNTAVDRLLASPAGEWRKTDTILSANSNTTDSHMHTLIRNAPTSF